VAWGFSPATYVRKHPARYQLRLLPRAARRLNCDVNGGRGWRRHLRQASGLPAIAGRGVVGAPGVQPFTPDPVGPSEPSRLVTGWLLPTDGPAEGPAGSGRAAGWTLGGDSAQCSPPSPGRNHGTTITPCRAPAARRAREAERERALAGCKRRRVRAVSARLGLKPYRKSSPPGMPVADRMCRRDRNGSGVGRLGFWVQHRRSWEDTWRSLIVR
jgi:hypothetical protein